MNVKLVGSLRNKVKTKVKKSLEEAEKAGGKEANKKNIVQKVRWDDEDQAFPLTRRRSLTNL